ncbi:MAG: phosphatase PAP2 family protein [Planctomycetaceae bacterium]|nr:phosphatase PAP2 family protein [Planctomycetaceae bacterium]
MLDPYERLILGSLLLVILCGWGFVALSEEVMEGDTQSIDERILLALRVEGDPTDPIGSAVWEDIGRDITALGGYAFLVLLMVGVTGYLFLAKKDHMGWFLIAAVVSGFLMTMALKSAFERPRPTVVTHHSYVETSSFPSGHSMMSMIVFLTMGALLARISKRRRLKIYCMTVAVILSLLVGCSRVYVGVHYPTDVLAGWSAGVVWATLSCMTAGILERKGVIGLHEPVKSVRDS